MILSSRPSRRRRLRFFWKDVQWPVMIALSLLAFALGLRGFSLYHARTGQAFRLLDEIYLSLQLFSLSSGIVDQPLQIPWELHLARYLAPLIAAYAFFQALLIVFRDQAELWKLNRIQRHALICGLGRKGLLLAQEFRRQGLAVVVIDRAPGSAEAAACREIGALVVSGDMRDPLVLSRARVDRARYLVAVSGDDGANIEAAAQARTLLAKRAGKARRRGELTCSVHIVDMQLWTVLREKELAADHTPGFRLEFFNVYAGGARLALREMHFPGSETACPVLLVIGVGAFTESLLIHAAQTWAPRCRSSGQKLPITVVDPEAERKVALLCARAPLLPAVCHLDARSIGVECPEFYQSDFLINGPDSANGAAVTHVIISQEDASLAISAGLELLRRVRGEAVNILVRMNEDSGLAELLRGVQGGSANLTAFGLLQRTCKPGLFDDGTHETLARVIHESYVESQAAGRENTGSPSLLPWEQLPEALRQSNRRQADDIGVKLNALGYGIAPWTEFGAEAFRFSPAEIETLAQMEHKRWSDDLCERGWQHGPERDPRRKLHPDLVAWDALSETEREKNRAAARRIPAYLALAGFQIYPLRPAAPEALTRRSGPRR